MRIEVILKQLAESQAQREALAAVLEKRDAALEQKDARILTLEREAAVKDAKIRLLEDETEVLMAQLRSLTRRLAEATRTDVQLALQFEINAIQRQLAAKNAELFAKKSERRSKGKNKKKPRAEHPGHGPTPQPDLPVDPQLHILDEADQICPKCGQPLNEWHGQTEDSEEITTVERTYKITRHQRQKYKCAGSDCDHIETALGPDKLIPGGRYSTDFVIQVAIDKYLDHLPLNRQVQRMRRAGLNTTRQTLWNQLEALYVLLLPSLLALHSQILDSPLVHADETTWPVIKPGKTKKWWVWGVRDDEGAYFLVVPSRGTAAGRELLQNYSGIVMADDYAVYTALEKLRSRVGGVQQVIVNGVVVDLPTPDFTLASCWAHIRRYFYKAEKSGDLRASEALDRIEEVYAIERAMKEEAADFAALLSQRALVRPVRCAEVLARLDVWRSEVKPLAGTALAKAVNHYDTVRDRSRVFLSEPLVPMDNNAMEREIRPIVQGRRAFQGSRSESGTRVAALFYSLFATCRIIGVDPRAYLAKAVQILVQKQRTVFLPRDHKNLIERIDETVEEETGTTKPQDSS